MATQSNSEAPGSILHAAAATETATDTDTFTPTDTATVSVIHIRFPPPHASMQNVIINHGKCE